MQSLIHPLQRQGPQSSLSVRPPMTDIGPSPADAKKRLTSSSDGLPAFNLEAGSTAHARNTNTSLCCRRDGVKEKVLTSAVLQRSVIKI